MVQADSLRIVVFAGAGASCFADLPTVCSFLKCVDWPPSSAFSAACQEVARKISIAEGNQKVVVWPDFDAEKLFGWLEYWQQAGRIDRRTDIPVPNLHTSISLDAVVSHLRRETVRIYGREIDPKKLSSGPYHSLFKLLGRITSPSEPLYVFTTNYDTVLEQLFDGHASSEMFRERLRICTGFSSGRPGQWQPALFSQQPANDERLIHLVKLHGSATWKRNESRQPVDTGLGMPTGQDCLLYFGYKSVPEEEPFVKFHNLLKETLLQCQVVIVIGFRFADPYIRELFDFALLANPRLRVICSLNRRPESNSPLSTMIERFPGRVTLLADASGEPIPFGHGNFPEVLEHCLTSAA